MSDVQINDKFKYTEKHEWIHVEGGSAAIGVSDFAQSALGDIVFIDLPKVGSNLKQFESFGTIESVKAAEDLYSPATGEVIAVNDAVNSTPDAVNKDPYSSWFVKIKLANPSELDKLMDAAKYKEYIQSLG